MRSLTFQDKRFDFLGETVYNNCVVINYERVINVATVSFDKNIVITEPDAVKKLVTSLLDDKPREIDKHLASGAEITRGEQLLKQCLSRSKN